MGHNFRDCAIWTTALFFFAAIAGCDQAPDLDDIRDGGGLIVLTRNAPTTYYVGREGFEEGPEYDLASLFAEHLGVEARFKTFDTVAEILAAVATGEGHLAAAGLTDTAERRETFLFGPAYQSIHQELICHREGPVPKSVEVLGEVGITVIADSSYVETLNALSTTLPELNWQTTDQYDTEALLEMVAERKLDCTIADSNIVAVNSRYYPELSAVFSISDSQNLAWIVAEDAKALLPELETWFKTIRKNGQLAAIHHRYYGYIEIFDYVDKRAFTRRIQNRLPKLRRYFEASAKKFDLPWDLLAAVGYQESHWNPKAKSPTGVRGVMMLTRNTAKSLGVTDRLNPAQSILGGAKYLDRQVERLPETITGEDRLWIGLAAYNIGMAHIRDARDLARRLGRDPDTWVGLREVLPLLAQKRYYKSLENGYARGRESVIFVRRVRNYLDILQHQLGLKAQSGHIIFF